VSCASRRLARALCSPHQSSPRTCGQTAFDHVRLGVDWAQARRVRAGIDPTGSTCRHRLRAVVSVEELAGQAIGPMAGRRTFSERRRRGTR
jgi:hypothetical protein